MLSSKVSRRPSVEGSFKVLERHMFSFKKIIFRIPRGAESFQDQQQYCLWVAMPLSLLNLHNISLLFSLPFPKSPWRKRCPRDQKTEAEHRSIDLKWDHSSSRTLALIACLMLHKAWNCDSLASVSCPWLEGFFPKRNRPAQLWKGGGGSLQPPALEQYKADGSGSPPREHPVPLPRWTAPGM